MRNVMTLIGLILVIFQMPSAFPQEPIKPLDFTEPQPLNMRTPDMYVGGGTGYIG